jgi:4-amino-4-deoxy-L-arabinose transferase-like glycosyltransferase
MFLHFSDSAKFADVARNLVNGLGYGSNFSFWSISIFGLIKTTVFSWFSTPPIMPFSIAVFFKIFGVNDFAVIATSFFYFLLTLIFVFLLAKKVFKSNLVGVLSTLAVGFNYDLINYATSGASESPFIFEIIAASYFISLKKKWSTIMAFLFLVLMYFTRPQAFIYITGIIFYWFLNNFKIKKATICFVGILIAGFLVDHYVLTILPDRLFLYSVTARGIGAATQIVSGGSPSDSLRGNVIASTGIITIATKIFYNLYNFYKLMPQILNPYLFALFVIGLFRWGKGRMLNSFKIATLFMFLLTLLVASASIPFLRYIHPVIPLVYIIAVGTLVEIISNFQFPISNQIQIFKFKISKQATINLSSLFLILLFGVGQTLGIFLLDSRFEANTHNIGIPPVYVALSYKLRDNTNKNDVVLTNLDTWGSWYGERKTVWFPLEPKQLIDPATGEIPFDAIYLTSYLIDDENYYMGADWRLIFNNPNDPKKWTCEGCAEIAKEFQLKGLFKVVATEDYERQDASAIILIKK